MPRAPGGRYAPAGLVAVGFAPAVNKATLAFGVGAGGTACGKGPTASTGIGLHDAWYNSSTSCTCISGPLQCQTLMPLSTRNRGDKVAVRMKRPHGDHSKNVVFGASMVAIFWRERRSNTLMGPDMFPKPARAIKRPCGLKEIKFCGAVPKSWMILTWLSKRTALVGVTGKKMKP